MAETEQLDTATTAVDATDAAATGAKARFSKALDEAKSSAVALTKDLQEKAAPHIEQLSAQAKDKAAELGGEVKEKALELANDGKTKASDALAAIGKLIADNAEVLDDKVGNKYGDYARTAARQLQETAAGLESKDLAELGAEAKDYIKKHPGVAIGAAAVIGFFLARALKGSPEAGDDTDTDEA
ncbi:hypothetical protein GTZ99_07120 [Novosphingobium sp. FSY-8]|uniref:ElaB/YqjD/DUF883 family membrane-anchored ribosome-binding protein n=1 Tax=Novosphingobium ovatum TaxID=1908523 RepID=A0ABW9XCP7_9SPHN|nr:hypothetical protein [Novosphingobium ovatum]NBC36327.1 hypothetical protein [Novosphingobium ovatum]